MTKLPENKKFLDLSDYARPIARIFVNAAINTKINSYHFTYLFLIVGLLASYLICIEKYPFIASVLILLKSALDASDGEIARRRNEPSMVGRYLDSIFDLVVNVALFFSIAFVYSETWLLVIFSLISYQLQGSIFNYYYLIKRYQVNGDKTSRIFEKEEPKPFKRDNVFLLKILHKIYLFSYAWQDYLVHKLDRNAINTKELPNWFLTFVSIFGLGFQLLIIAVFITLNIHQNTFWFFLLPYNILAISVIYVRKIFVK